MQLLQRGMAAAAMCGAAVLGLGTNALAGGAETGACCLLDDCVEYVEEVCDLYDGRYLGDGTTCDDSPCTTAACCINGLCTDGMSAVDCAIATGEYQGDDSDCASVVCDPPTAACCVAGETCSVTTEAYCSTIGGVWQFGFGCGDIICAPTGACCIDGSCTDGMSAADCAIATGEYQGDDSDCASGVCDPPTAACCVNGDTCDVTTEADCVDVWYAGFSCEQINCDFVGVCCIIGDCYDGTIGADCVVAGGVYGGDGTNCVSYTCPPDPVGACCFTTGCGDGWPQTYCETADGHFLGGGTDCSNDPCPPVPTGVCCFYGECGDGYPKPYCESVGGFFGGDGTACATYSCPPSSPGACCFDEGCSVVLLEVCGASGGVFLGGSCAAATCDGPRCCKDGECLVGVPSSDFCAAHGGIWLSYPCELSSTCGDGGACCLGGEQCIQTLAAHCDALGGDWTLQASCETVACDGGSYVACDINLDGSIDIIDLQIILENWNPGGFAIGELLCVLEHWGS